MKKRNKHNLSHYRLTTFNPGELVPVSCVEVLPGDSFEHTAAVLLRCSPLLAPVMHRAMVRVHHFFVPNRITWPASDNGGWEAFITQSHDGDLDVPEFEITEGSTDASFLRLLEHLGCPLETLSTGQNIAINQLPVRAYRAIWNEWFRDKNLQSVLDLDEEDSGIQRVCWSKDDFTAARTSPQQGGDVTLPIGTTAPVTVDTSYITVGGPVTGNLGNIQSLGDDGVSGPVGIAHAGAHGGGPTDITLAGSADLASATGISVSALREALALQRYAERLQAFGGGSDYSQLLASLGVPSSDSRLQKPEYLGGGKSMISFSEVLQTSNGSAGPDDVVGSMYGHGISPSRTNKYRRFFNEHGFLISLISVVPQSIYANAVPRHWFKGFDGGLASGVDRLIDDYWQPELETIGEQAILKKEIYPTGTAGDETVFGYSPRYYEYRHHPSQVVGEFKPGGALEYFTWARSFASQPTLNSSFVNCDPSNRIFADQTGTDVLWCAVNHRLVARRLVTKRVIGRVL